MAPTAWPQARRLLYEATAPFQVTDPSVDLRFGGATVNPGAEVVGGTGKKGSGSNNPSVG